MEDVKWMRKMNEGYKVWGSLMYVLSNGGLVNWVTFVVAYAYIGYIGSDI